MSEVSELASVSVVAGVAIQQDGKILLVQEGQGPSKGKWNFPAGRVEQGNSIEDTAYREAFEESGVTVQLGRKLGVWHTDLTHPVCHLFVATIIGGEIQAAPYEIAAIDWFTLEEIKAMHDQLRMIWVSEGAQRLIETE